MGRWYWVRHGPTHAKAMVGWSDLPADLSDTAALGRLAAGLPEAALVVSSDLIRARDTASAIARGRERLADRQGLREMNYGDWEGLGFEEIARTDPARARKFWEAPGRIGPPNGEAWNDFSRRIFGEIAALDAAYPERDLVLVAHFGVILAALQFASGMAAKSVFSFRIDNLSVTRIDRLSGEKWRVDRVNHLP